MSLKDGWLCSSLALHTWLTFSKTFEVYSLALHLIFFNVCSYLQKPVIKPAYTRHTHRCALGFTNPAQQPPACLRALTLTAGHGCPREQLPFSVPTGPKPIAGGTAPGLRPLQAAFLPRAGDAGPKVTKVPSRNRMLRGRSELRAPSSGSIPVGLPVSKTLAPAWRHTVSKPRSLPE